MTQHKCLRKLLADAVEAGFVLYCIDGELDYKGQDVTEALDALTACDVMTLRICHTDGKQTGVALIVNEHNREPEEQIADHGGTRCSG